MTRLPDVPMGRSAVPRSAIPRFPDLRFPDCRLPDYPITSEARVALQSNDVILYFIGSGKAAEDRALRSTLEDMALETGGAAYFEGRLLDTADRFRDIVSDLSSQYLLSFSPTKPLGDGRWRPLKVTVRNSRLRVRARQGYFAVAR